MQPLFSALYVYFKNQRLSARTFFVMNSFMIDTNDVKLWIILGVNLNNKFFEKVFFTTSNGGMIVKQFLKVRSSSAMIYGF